MSFVRANNRLTEGAGITRQAGISQRKPESQCKIRPTPFETNAPLAESLMRTWVPSITTCTSSAKLRYTMACSKASRHLFSFISIAIKRAEPKTSKCGRRNNSPESRLSTAPTFSNRDTADDAAHSFRKRLSQSCASLAANFLSANQTKTCRETELSPRHLGISPDHIPNNISGITEPMVGSLRSRARSPEFKSKDCRI